MSTKAALPMITELAREKRTCPTHGEYEAIQSKIFGNVQWTTCDKCDKAREAKAVADEKYAKRIKNFALPVRFRDAEFDTYRMENKGQQSALMICKAYANEFGLHRADGRCLILVGPPGTGKTHLAIAVAKQAMRAGYTARYTTVYEAIEAIRDTWRRDSAESEGDVLKRMTTVDLLVLDEVGVQYGKESEQVEMFKILNKRYNDMSPTIVLSNVPPDELKKYLGERAYDRLRENGGKAVAFDWESYRK